MTSRLTHFFGWLSRSLSASCFEADTANEATLIFVLLPGLSLLPFLHPLCVGRLLPRDRGIEISQSRENRKGEGFFLKFALKVCIVHSTDNIRTSDMDVLHSE